MYLDFASKDMDDAMIFKAILTQLGEREQISADDNSHRLEWLEEWLLHYKSNFCVVLVVWDFAFLLGGTDRFLYGLFELMTRSNRVNLIIVGTSCDSFPKMNKRAASRLELNYVNVNLDSLEGNVKTLCNDFLCVKDYSHSSVNLQTSAARGTHVVRSQCAALAEAASVSRDVIKALAFSDGWRSAAERGETLHWFVNAVFHSIPFIEGTNLCSRNQNLTINPRRVGVQRVVELMSGIDFAVFIVICRISIFHASGSVSSAIQQGRVPNYLHINREVNQVFFLLRGSEPPEESEIWRSIEKLKDLDVVEAMPQSDLHLWSALLLKETGVALVFWLEDIQRKNGDPENPLREVRDSLRDKIMQWIRAFSNGSVVVGLRNHQQGLRSLQRSCAN